MAFDDEVFLPQYRDVWSMINEAGICSFSVFLSSNSGRKGGIYLVMANGYYLPPVVLLAIRRQNNFLHFAKLWEQIFIVKSNLLLKVFKCQWDNFLLAKSGFICKLAAKISRVSIHPIGSNILTMHLMHKPAHDTTYNKTCVTQQGLGSACPSTQYGKCSLLSPFG